MKTDNEVNAVNLKKRKHRVVISMNDEEMRLIERYANKYRLKTPIGAMREAIMRAFLKQLDEDRPTLFD
jgi:predicted hydrolase (HD superfamily)